MEEGGSEMGAKERKGTSKSGWGTEQCRQEAEEGKKKKRETMDKDASPFWMEENTGVNV